MAAIIGLCYNYVKGKNWCRASTSVLPLWMWWINEYKIVYSFVSCGESINRHWFKQIQPFDITPQNIYPENKQSSFLLCNSPSILFLLPKLFSEFSSESHSICVIVTQRRSSTPRLKKLSFVTFEVVKPVTGNMWHHVFWYIFTKLYMLTQY